MDKLSYEDCRFLKLRDWINNNIDKLDWEQLSSNPNSIHFIEKI